MRRHIAYGKYLLNHRWFVFWALMQHVTWASPALSLKIIWRGIKHDWHKFLPDEWLPYARYFYNPDGSKAQRRDKTGYYKAAETGNDAFDMAWLLHQKRADHHWQWWTLPLDDGGLKVLNMSHLARIEMHSDWIGAGKAQKVSNIDDKKLELKRRVTKGELSKSDSEAELKTFVEEVAAFDRTWEWYAKNKDKMQLHEDTRAWIEKELILQAYAHDGRSGYNFEHEQLGTTIEKLNQQLGV
jgi:hypothetical protein